MSVKQSSPVTEHTPTPWATMGDRGDIKAICKGFPEKMVTKVLGQETSAERTANAAFIVRAVNNFEAMAKALQLAEAILNIQAYQEARPIEALGPIRRALADAGVGYLSPQVMESLPHD